jgi:protein-S-isoprenylcysteine O-methyltransferase Ste14
MTAEHHKHGPGVKIPPPVVPVTLVALAYLCNQLWPLPLKLDHGLGWVLLAIGIVLSGATFIQFLLFKTSIIPHRPDQQLMSGGVFIISRNPIYLSFLIFQTAASDLMQSWWPVVLLPVCYGFLRFYVIAKEERYLEHTFGEEYQQLLRKTRRWL